MPIHPKASWCQYYFQTYNYKYDLLRQKLLSSVRIFICLFSLSFYHSTDYSKAVFAYKRPFLVSLYSTTFYVLISYIECRRRLQHQRQIIIFVCTISVTMIPIYDEQQQQQRLYSNIRLEKWSYTFEYYSCRVGLAIKLRTRMD